MTLPLGRLLGKDMSQVGLTSFEASLPGTAKTLRRAAITFHLRHYILRLFGLIGINCPGSGGVANDYRLTSFLVLTP